MRIVFLGLVVEEWQHFWCGGWWMGCIHCCIEIVGVGCFGGLEFHQRVIRVRRSIYTIMPQMKDNRYPS